jgi:hypothetical protein
MPIGPMYTRREEPFPLEAAVDLRAVARALYLVARSRGDRGAMAQLQRIGAELTLAIDLGQRCAVGTAGHQAALRRVEQAIAAIGNVLDPLMPATELLEAAQARVLRKMRA